MDVDHDGTPMMTIGTGDASVIVGMVTDLTIIDDIAGIAATGEMTVNGDDAIETGAAIEPGVAAAARGSSESEK